MSTELVSGLSPQRQTDIYASKSMISFQDKLISRKMSDFKGRESVILGEGSAAYAWKHPEGIKSPQNQKTRFLKIQN